MTDINTTTYLTKPNVETTRYFIPADPSTEIWIELNKKEYIVDHNADITAIDNSLTNLSERVSTNETNIESINENINILDTSISNVSERVSTNETNISLNASEITSLQESKEDVTTHNTDIQNLQTQIDNLNLGTTYEGYYYSIYSGANNKCKIRYNYNKGDMIFWYGNDHLQAAINDIASTLMSMSIKELTLPGNVKKINSSGEIVEYYTDILYLIDQVTVNSRGSMSDLTSITTEQGVYKIQFDLTAAPSLRYFNLMEGLREIDLIGTMTTITPNMPDSSKLINLKIPSSVIKCTLKNILFGDLTFEGYTSANNSSTNELSLTFNKCWISDKLYLTRELSSFTASNQSDVVAPPVIETSFSLLCKIDNTTLGNRFSAVELTQTTLILHRSEMNTQAYSSMPNTLTFKRIFNYTKYDHSTYTKLSAGSWIE